MDLFMTEHPVEDSRACLRNWPFALRIHSVG
jgi:hypothetical protein